MKVIQIVTNLNLGDAIGNEILAMDEALKYHGYNSQIMAITIHEMLQSRAFALDLSCICVEDLVIFHKATGDIITKEIANLSCKKVMVYHNITPAKYFLPYDRIMAYSLWLGRHQLRQLTPHMDACWADSSFNAEELLRYGALKEKTTVLPILFSENRESIIQNTETARKLQNNKGTKLLCIGRIVPNKKLEDAIKLFVRYIERYDNKAILYLLGSWAGLEKYYAKLKGFCADLGLKEDQVVFTGHVSEEEKEAYLNNTDVLLCMSEHEGFCVPLIEAMSHNLPILAYAFAAVPETLGDNGLLFSKKEYGKMANAINCLHKDETFRNSILKAQQKSLQRFDRATVLNQFIMLINDLVPMK